MDFAVNFAITIPYDLRKSVIKASEDGKDRPKRENIVKVPNNIVSVVKNDVQRAVSQHHSRETSHSKKEDEAGGPKHRSVKS